MQEVDIKLTSFQSRRSVSLNFLDRDKKSKFKLTPPNPKLRYHPLAIPSILQLITLSWMLPRPAALSFSLLATLLGRFLGCRAAAFLEL